ncbi:MAG: DUF393 domain-containing protein [Chloroflexi bacterium]|nr:DUF393 domain-containing protein [Chloroflexota bacterium]MCY3581664.1 DUF393 domain-containing protein [Chloroflexota bacterium]MCY3717174.1 DUF393 domain-containing protein [Chloroflexota bacterium]MDE2650391.1 DUF393 domain-containing protein [Chloroflexota bacterium]MXV92268.1 DUF393 domain-containing protein [Chloroflexota bacterium]
MRDTAITALYDGNCRLCRASCRWLRRLDWRDRITFSDLHTSEALPKQALLGEIVVLDGARRYAGFAGLRRLLRELPLGIPAWLLLHAPGAAWLGARFYRLVARNRYRIGGGAGCASGACAVDTAARSQ